MNKCWGCHHPTEKAFAPSFRWIIDHRSESWIRAQILSPKSTAEHLGYQRSVMPQLAISDAEMQALLSFMREQKQED